MARQEASRGEAEYHLERLGGRRVVQVTQGTKNQGKSGHLLVVFFSVSSGL